MFRINLQLFAHKKGVGSSRNGRESESKRLGPKRADTLFAKVDGILRFETKHGGRKCVSVYPEEIAG